MTVPLTVPLWWDIFVASSHLVLLSLFMLLKGLGGGGFVAVD